MNYLTLMHRTVSTTIKSMHPLTLEQCRSEYVGTVCMQVPDRGVILDVHSITFKYQYCTQSMNLPMYVYVMNAHLYLPIVDERVEVKSLLRDNVFMRDHVLFLSTTPLQVGQVCTIAFVKLKYVKTKYQYQCVVST